MKVQRHKEGIKIYFSDFWPGYEYNDNVFVKALSKDYNVIITDDCPDLLFYSFTGREFEKFDCIRIYYTPENLAPKYKECDFSISYNELADPRNLRLPYYATIGINPNDLVKTRERVEKILIEKTGFCSMVVTNGGCPKRNNFFLKLSKYKQVVSGGKFMNNIGGHIDDKHDFIKKFKFNICFENTQSSGYTTEKLLHAMNAMTMPIYWGNPWINYEFNHRSFFNYDDYSSEEDLIEDIVEHDKDIDKYIQKFMEPWFEDNVPNEYFDIQRIRKFLNKIISNKKSITPIARNSFKRYFYFPVGYRVNMLKGQLGNVFRKFKP